MPEYRYPLARIGEDADDYHGELVGDPYRWLEESDSLETAAWIKAENETTEEFLRGVNTRAQIRARLSELWDYPKYGVPFEVGGRWFQWRNPGLANQPLFYVMDGPAAEGRVLIDPNLLAEDGTVAVTSLDVSPDGTKVAYAISAAGSDWRTWQVRDVFTGEDHSDLVEWSKFTKAAWRTDGSGFYYAGVAAPAAGEMFTGQNRLSRVMFHRLGTDQASDEVVFDSSDQPDWLLETFAVTDDGRYLAVSVTKGNNPETDVHVLDLARPGIGFQPLVVGFDITASVITNFGSVFYLVTSFGADRQRVVAAELGAAGRDHWREIIAEAPDVLLHGRFYGGKLVCHYLHHAQSLLRVHELDGRHVRDLPVPSAASLAYSEWDPEIAGRSDSDLMHFEVTSFTDSGSVWSHDLRTGETKLARPAGAPIDQEAFITDQVFVPAGAETRIPVFLTRRRDVQPTGEVPVLLYGYGGLNIPVTPEFRPDWLAWIERGGMLAVANLRGGGEYGHSWHDAGRLARKQNVFDDFCACARWLASSGWSTSRRIAINGKSNGGLLVGACLTQRPELFGAAVAEVGVLDMLRFHKFTIGWAWTCDFGNPDDPQEYEWLRAYSPLHQVRPGTRYPATLVLACDRDDRVVPGHSFKFTAALQAAQAGSAPVLIRIESSAGHGLGKPTQKLIAERTDVLAFLEAALAVSPARSTDDRAM